MKVFSKPASIRLDDEKAERVRREHAQAIAEVQASAALQLQIIEDVALADGVETPIPHGLGRMPRTVKTSVPRGPVSTGRIEELRNGKVRRDRAVVLKASGFGATITVDVEVM